MSCLYFRRSPKTHLNNTLNITRNYFALPIAYSVVVPVYNSEKTLTSLYERSAAFFEERGACFEFVFVEDCGQDKSWEVLLRLKYLYAQHNITIVKLFRNYGQHSATLCGMGYAQGEWIITIDDDLQTPPEEIGKLLDKQAETGAEVIYGIYRQKKHSYLRNLGSKYAKKILSVGSPRHRNGSSFRLINGEIARNMTRHMQHFVFIDRLLLWYTQHIELVEVVHVGRAEGQSGYSFLKLVSLTLGVLVAYTDIPLLAMIYGGLSASVLSFLTGLYYIYLYFTQGFIPGFASVIVSIFFVAGALLCCIGIIGEYIRRIYVAQYQAPQYAVKTVVQ